MALIEPGTHFSTREWKTTMGQQILVSALSASIFAIYEPTSGQHATELLSHVYISGACISVFCIILVLSSIYEICQKQTNSPSCIKVKRKPTGTQPSEPPRSPDECFKNHDSRFSPSDSANNPNNGHPQKRKNSLSARQRIPSPRRSGPRHGADCRAGTSPSCCGSSTRAPDIFSRS